MDLIFMILAGMFSANGIPHLVHGISGRDFHEPFFYRFTPKVPSYLFNAVWGLANFGLALFLVGWKRDWVWGWNAATLCFCAGFIFATVGLSLYFHARTLRESKA